MAKAKFTTIKNAVCRSYLIGDSNVYGKDQVISGIIKYNDNGLYDERNKIKINAAREMARVDGFNNIRIVTTYYDAICIYCGVIDYKKTKTSIKPFKFD